MLARALRIRQEVASLVAEIDASYRAREDYEIGMTEARFRSGVCRCGHERARDGSPFGEACLRSMALQRREWRASKRGACPDCGKRAERWQHGRCRACVEERKRTRTRELGRLRKRQRAGVTSYRCRVCGIELEDGRAKTCATHAPPGRARQERWRARVAVRPCCIECGVRVEKGQWERCRAHAKARTVELKRQRARQRYERAKRSAA